MGQLVVPSKKVYQYDLNGKFIKEWVSIREAANSDFNYMSGIRIACVGKVTSVCRTYRWFYSYQGKNIDTVRKHKRKRTIQIDKFSLEGTFIKTYDCFYDVAQDLNIKDTSHVLKKIKQNGKAYGYIFKYK